MLFSLFTYLNKVLKKIDSNMYYDFKSFLCINQIATDNNSGMKIILSDKKQNIVIYYCLLLFFNIPKYKF